MAVDNHDHMFRKYVDKILFAERSGFEVSRTYGITPLKQRFCFVITKAVWYAVRLVTETDRGDAKPSFIIPPIEQMHSFHIVERQEFFRRRAVDIYVRRRCDELEKGNYGDVYPARFLAMPKDVLTNPVRYLKRGDHLRRTVMCGIGFHDGIYLGDGRVAHLSPGASGSLFEKRDASARIDSLTDFAQDKQIVIVEHCIRRRLSADIADTAEEHCRQKLWHGQYDLSLQNCQHFAYMCACGSERMSPANRIMAAVVNAFPISLHS